MRLIDKTCGRVIADRVTRASSPWTRLVGWLHRDTVKANEGLWFGNCDVIHTLAMRSHLDLIFLDREQRVIALQEDVGSGRFIVSCPGAVAIVEMGPSFLWTHDVLWNVSLIGHTLSLEASPDQATTVDRPGTVSRRER